jgi:pyridinium-3,5-bisthiocarboxylic acid mononucleotide nickel chelatase
MLTGKHLYLDCTSGIAGDMFLGAAIDLGVPEAAIREGLGKLHLHGYRLEVGRKQHSGISGCDIKVVVEHDHKHDHGHEHRAWADIRQMIEGSGLGDPVKQRAIDIFSRVARAEAKLHDRPLEQVAFHEVGAVDSIVDIVGAALALDHLRPARVTSRPVPLGHGFCRCAHGVLPVPSPAAVAILSEVGASVEDGGLSIELCTPTGAAIVASCATEFGQIPAAPVLGAGYGAGDTELPDRPNHLRLLLFEPQVADAAERDAVVIEANIDDMPSEFCGYLLDRLFAAGARDVWFTPIVMKKGRPALTVSALCAADLREAVGAVLLAESTSIGYRYRPVGRRTLSRSSVEVATPFGAVSVKVASDGERVLNAAPEFEAVRRLAEAAGVSWKEVYAAALAGYRGLAESGSPHR